MKKLIAILVSVLLLATMVPMGVVSVGAESYEYAMFPMTYLRITQGVNGNYSHQGTKAIDIAGKDGGIDSAYAPFTGVIKRIYGGHTVWLESSNPVKYANGVIDYMTIMVVHDNDISDLYVGKTINQGERFYEEGTKGNADGNHIHLECGRGKFQGNGWYQNSQGKWMINNSIAPYDALYISKTTVVLEGYGYSWKVSPSAFYTSDNPNDYAVPTRSLQVTSPTMQGRDVAWVQAVLKMLGYTINIDGDYGPATEKVIKQFQTDYSLTIDGICGTKTTEKLQVLWEQFYQSEDPDDYTVPTRDLSFVTPPMLGRDVAWVQSVLKKLGYAINIDGVFGAATEATVKTFQTDYQLTVDGLCGTKTTQKLLEMWDKTKCVHIYDNTCDTDCNTCGSVREVPDHVYDDEYDSDCNVCGFIREVETATFGDLNSDGAINNRDLAMMQQYINGWEVIVDEDACDVNVDGAINNRDLALLQQYINGWDVTLGK